MSVENHGGKLSVSALMRFPAGAYGAFHPGLDRVTGDRAAGRSTESRRIRRSKRWLEVDSESGQLVDRKYVANPSIEDHSPFPRELR